MDTTTNPTTTATTTAPGVWPALAYDDAPAAIRFLEALGFVADLVVPGEGERAVAHAELHWPGGGGVMLGSAAGSRSAAAPGSAAVYVVTDDPDGLFARATAAGAEVVAGLADEDYGSRGFTIRDPEGGQWTFGTYRGAAAG
jgi:uncharacterized glyoxalase superfamily protein PhnB